MCVRHPAIVFPMNNARAGIAPSHNAMPATISGANANVVAASMSAAIWSGIPPAIVDVRKRSVVENRRYPQRGLGFWSNIRNKIGKIDNPNIQKRTGKRRRRAMGMCIGPTMW
jgi:hypothetical protein